MKQYLKSWMYILFSTAIFSSQFTCLAAEILDESYCCESAPCAECPTFGVTVDFLWWQLRQTQGFATEYFTTTSDVASFSEAKTIYPSFDYEPGVRVGLRAYNTCDCFDVGIIWTHFCSNHTTTKNARYPELLSLQTAVTHARIAFKCQLDYVDIDFSKTLCLTPCFLLTPHIGARGLWLNVHQKARGEGNIPDFATNRFSSVNLKFHDAGYGIEGGLWMQWNLPCQLSLVGHFGGSTLYLVDSFKVSDRVINYDETNTVTSDSLSISKARLDSATYTTDCYLGLQYNWNICGYDVMFTAGWESLFMNFEFYQFQGLTTGLSVNF